MFCMMFFVIWTFVVSFFQKINVQMLFLCFLGDGGVG